MTIEEIRETDWYKSRPEIIRQAIDLVPPNQLYKVKDTGKQCLIISIEEPESGRLEDVTFTIQKTGVGGSFEGTLLEQLDTRFQVFGLKREDLEPWID